MNGEQTTVQVRHLAVKGAISELAGYAAGQALRFVSTIILSRLLFPEAFGLAMIVAIAINGLVMLSDAGIEQSFVQNKDGDSRQFRNTAWTIAVIRGGVLWLLSCLIAFPLAHVYEEPALVLLIPIGSLGLLIGGFASTSLLTLRRQMAISTLVGIELVTQLISFVVTVGWALVDPSVWALVAGGLANAFVKTCISYAIDRRFTNRFEWDWKAAAAMYLLGKWIFASSALTFFSRQADRLIIGSLMGVATLGVYGMAVLISEAVSSLVGRITSGVLFPALSRVAREDASRLGNAYYRTRLRTDLLGLAPAGALIALAQPVVDIMYDERYSDAGWMLQILLVRVAMSVVVESMQNCLFSLGHTRYGFYQNVARSIWVLVGLPLGWHIGGLEGLIVVVGLSEVPALILVVLVFRRFGLLRLKNELISIATLALGLITGLVVLWTYSELLNLVG